MSIDVTPFNPEPEKYSVIYADPPWMPGQTGKRGASEKYHLMTTESICKMPVSGLAADDAVLLLWVVNNGLQDGLEVRWLPNLRAGTAVFRFERG